MAEHNLLGEQGEQLAVNYLLDKGYVILEKNYRYRKAEVDIIARVKDVLVVIEVKTRSSDYFGSPEEFVSQKKIELLRSAIDYYVQENDLDVEVRFDIVAIIKKKDKPVIRYIEDAFLFF